MQCETYNEAGDIQYMRAEWDGECKRSATREVTTKQGKVLNLCGYCARGWKQSAISIKVINKGG